VESLLRTGSISGFAIPKNVFPQHTAGASAPLADARFATIPAHRGTRPGGADRAGDHGEGMTADLAAKLAFLRTPGALDGAVECVETHMSWVFLTEHRAFKLKKPVKLPYVDYSTLDRRRQSCEQELRLGRRLAASVYFDVVPLEATPRGLAVGAAPSPAPPDPAIRGSDAGEIVDWLVVMRRLPAERMLPRVLERGAATLPDADTVGVVLAEFYRAASRARWDGAEYLQRLRSLTVTVGGELVVRGASPARVRPIVQAQLGMIEREPRALAARIAAGRVVDAHGDLRPEHVCLEPRPVVIDPLEFDDELRTMDAASELAFFALECERLGARWFGERVVARCTELIHDQVSARIVALYRGQHALTRALIALRHLDDAAPSDQPRWRTRANDYLARACPTADC
jgi:aminoglycoside phosphotransferase family enzyme